MNIFDIVKQDKSLIFSDFPVIDFQREDAIDKNIWIKKHVLVSAIGVEQTSEGMTIGTDHTELTFDVNSFAAGKIPRENDLVKYTNEDGNEITLRIDIIARDKSDVSLGLRLCYGVEVAEENKAGQIDRERK